MDVLVILVTTTLGTVRGGTVYSNVVPVYWLVMLVSIVLQIVTVLTVMAGRSENIRYNGSRGCGCDIRCGGCGNVSG